MKEVVKEIHQEIVPDPNGLNGGLGIAPQNFINATYDYYTIEK